MCFFPGSHAKALNMQAAIIIDDSQAILNVGHRLLKGICITVMFKDQCPSGLPVALIVAHVQYLHGCRTAVRCIQTLGNCPLSLTVGC